MTTQTSGQTRGAAIEGKRSLVAVAASVFAVTVVAAVAWGLWSAVADEQTVTGAPQEIAGYRIQDAIGGAQAVASMERLHGKDVGVAGGWIARYEGGGTIWLAEAADEDTAGGLLLAMTDRIADGNESFTGLQKESFGGMTVYSVLGQGQRHYYYAHGKQLVWVAAPSGAEERFFSDALEKLISLEGE